MHGWRVRSGPGRKVRRTLAAGTLALPVSLLAFSATALAQPSVSITHPSGGSTVHERTPTIEGTTSDTLDSVTVTVLEGGTPLWSSEAQPDLVSGEWSAGVSTQLSDGSYEIEARQTEGLTGETGKDLSSFSLETPAPTVTLDPIETPSKDTGPEFTGFASESTQVTVHVFHGSSASGAPAATVHADGTGGSWRSGEAGPLAEGEYTAVAEQEGAFRNGTGESGEVHFTVITASPHLTLNSVKSPSGNSSPSFSGTASEQTEVTVLIYKGSSASGSPVSSASAAGGGGFSTGPASPALEDGTYTARATQSSSLGNPPGVSNEVTFTVDTSSPVVTLTGPPARSNKTNPTFSGTASDSTSVVVHIFDSASHEVASASGTPSSGSWKSGSLTKTLASGSYTAYAEQASSLGNAPGRSATVSFTVETSPPGVTIDEIGGWKSTLTPTFSGATTEAGTVTVSVLRGTTEVAKATATASLSEGHWAWKSGPISPALRSEVATYSVYATQSSAIGNPPGKSKVETLKIDPGVPNLVMTAPRAQTNEAAPAFSGTSDQTQPVTVKVFARPPSSTSCETTGAAIAQASGAGKVWSTAKVSPALAQGQYAAVAFQPRAGGGNEASTAPACFAVDETPPVVSVTAPTPGAVLGGGVVDVAGVAGTAPHDEARVTAQLFAGSTVAAGATPLQQIVVATTGAKWTAAFAGIAHGSYVIRAQQSDAAGNVGLSAAVPFTESGGASTALTAAGPLASFSWYPAKPHTGEKLTLISNSTDSASPITGYAWNLAGAFVAGGQSLTTSFASPGAHPVQLRVADANGRTGVVGATIQVSYPLMRPFPVVRISTTRSGGQIRLKLLSVQAPRGARIQVSCIGKGCPLRSQSRAVSATLRASSVSLTFPRFERKLPAGVSLQVRVYAPGREGKFTSFKVRRGKLPLRSDACLQATAPSPVTCSG